jgi:hypothetical protein
MMNVCVLKDFRVLVYFVKIVPLTIHGGKEIITNVLNQIGRNNMSSSMNTEKAHEIAKQMTYRDAVYNALQGRCVPFKKATRIKLKELLELVDKCDLDSYSDDKFVCMTTNCRALVPINNKTYIGDGYYKCAKCNCAFHINMINKHAYIMKGKKHG